MTPSDEAEEDVEEEEERVFRARFDRLWWLEKEFAHVGSNGCSGNKQATSLVRHMSYALTFKHFNKNATV